MIPVENEGFQGFQRFQELKNHVPEMKQYHPPASPPEEKEASPDHHKGIGF